MTYIYRGNHSKREKPTLKKLNATNEQVTAAYVNAYGKKKVPLLE